MIYQVSGPGRIGDKASIAQDVHDALESLLVTLRGARVVVVGDMNAVASPLDR